MIIFYDLLFTRVLSYLLYAILNLKKMLELNFRGFSCFNRTLLAVRETVSLTCKKGTFCIRIYCIQKLFSPRVMFALVHMQIVSPCLEFDQALLCLKRYNLRQWNSSRFIFADDQAKIKRGEYLFVLYTVMYIGGFQIPSHRMINRLLLYFSPHYDCVMKEA